MTAASAPVYVHKWGEAVAEKNIANAVRVFVDGQHAGAFGLEDGVWHAHRPHPTKARKSIETEHASADEALKAVLRSGIARRLGARAASRVVITSRAAKIMGRAA